MDKASRKAQELLTDRWPKRFMCEEIRDKQLHETSHCPCEVYDIFLAGFDHAIELLKSDEADLYPATNGLGPMQHCKTWAKWLEDRR